jgi:hypothetical protein
MTLKLRNLAVVLVVAALTAYMNDPQPSEARGGPRGGSGGHSSSSHSASSGHAYGGGHGWRRGHRYRPYNDPYEEEARTPVNNQFDQYIMHQDAQRVALPREAFVHEYHWPASQPAQFQSVVGQKIEAPVPQGLKVKQMIFGQVKAPADIVPPPLTSRQ